MITMTALHSNPLFDRLADAESILVTGAGGGFDIYAGLPVALSLMHQGKRVQLANLSFSSLAGLPIEAWVAPDLAAVTPDSAPHLSYFPERTLAQWLATHGYPDTVYAFPRPGCSRCATPTASWSTSTASTRSSWSTAARTS